MTLRELYQKLLKEKPDILSLFPKLVTENDLIDLPISDILILIGKANAQSPDDNGPDGEKI